METHLTEEMAVERLIDYLNSYATNEPDRGDHSEYEINNRRFITIEDTIETISTRKPFTTSIVTTTTGYILCIGVLNNHFVIAIDYPNCEHDIIDLTNHSSKFSEEQENRMYELLVKYHLA